MANCDMVNCKMYKNACAVKGCLAFHPRNSSLLYHFGGENKVFSGTKKNAFSINLESNEYTNLADMHKPLRFASCIGFVTKDDTDVRPFS